MSLEVSDYNLLTDFRKGLFKRVLENKTTLLDFVYGSFNFLKQYKIKPIANPTTKEEIILTYLFWHIHVERKVMVERKLIDQGLGSKEELDEVVQKYIKQRDKALRRLFYDLQEPIKEAYLIFEDVVEVILNDGQIVYTSLDSLLKLKIKVSQIKKTANPKYIQAIKLK